MVERNRYPRVTHRMVTNGDVILVHQVARTSEPPVSPAREKEQEAPEVPVEGYELEPEPMMVQAGEPWPYTPAPPGFAYEFGTGRLIRIGQTEE